MSTRMDKTMADGRTIERLRRRYPSALLAGVRGEAVGVVTDAMDRGTDPSAIYLEIFGPALADVGNAWVQGDLNIAAEHLATNITLEQIAHVRELAQTTKEIRVTAVMVTVGGEMHSVGPRIIANLLQMEGWDVALLGDDTPTGDLVAFVSERRPDLVLLSLSSPDSMPDATRATVMLKALEDAPAVFVGGAGLSSAQARNTIPADLISSDPREAIRAASELFSLERERRTLEDHLGAICRSVQSLRRERGWSQQELGSRAGLDRPYLSDVEQGRQNITIAAAVRIADALDTSLSALIGED